MNKDLFLKIIFLVLIAYQLPLQAIVQGSDAAVSIQPAFTFPASDTDNRMAGFGWFRNGFSLEDYTTSCTFDSSFQVSGPINLNGGTLYLNQDLQFSNIATLLGMGTVLGNGYMFDMCASITSFPQNTYMFDNSCLFINNDVTVTSTIIFRGNSIINGNGYAINLGDSGGLAIASGSTLSLKNIIIEDIAGSNIYFTDDSSSLILDNVVWSQSDDYDFPLGSMQFLNIVEMAGAYNFNYESAQTSTISQNSEWQITNGMQLNIGQYQLGASVQPIAFTDLSSILRMTNCILNVNPHGIQLTKGTVAVERDFQVDVQGTSSMTGLIFGDGTPQGDMIFDLYPGSSTRYLGGNVTYNITNGNGIRSNTTATTLVRAATSIFWLPQSLTLSNLTLELNASAVLNVSPGQTLAFSNCVTSLAQGDFELNAERYNTYTILLNGNQSIFLIKGALPLYTLVSSTGNIIEGNGSVTGQIILQNSNAQLSWAVEGQLLNTLVLNGGQLTLLGDFDCANGVQFAGPGIVHLGNVTFNLGLEDLEWPDEIYWDGSQGVLNINSNITLSSLWTFSGDCMVDGHGATLDIDNGALAVEAGSTLRLKNMRINNIGDNNIYCIDDAGTLILDSVIWNQDANLTFTLGSIEWKNNVIMQGQGTQFAYQSDRISTILDLSSLILDEAFTFSYDSSSSSLLQFSSSTSRLVLNLNAMLHATIQGLDLIAGNIIIHDNALIGGETWISSDLSVTIDNGISLGDCNIGANDCVLTIDGGVSLTIASGSLNYMNVYSNSLFIKNNLCALSILGNASLNVYQTMSMGNAITTMGNSSTLGRAPGAQFNGSISTQGVASFPSLNPC